LTWVLPGAAALHFTVAEVQFLFPAPLARRRLLAYKLFRLLLAALGTPVFLTLVVGPVGIGAAALFYAKVAAIAAVIALYEAGVSLYRINTKGNPGLTGRHRLAVVGASAAFVAAGAGLLTRFAFAPVRESLLLAPLVGVMLAAQAAWVLRSDAAFEEAAAIAAEQTRTALAPVERPKPAFVPVPRRTPFRLAATGRPETAILWKNWMLLSRTPAKQGIVTAAIVLAIAAGAAGFGVAKGDPVGGVLGFVIAGAAALFGPAMLRIDLRQDLANLIQIKTWPIRGAAIVRGQVLAPAIALSAAAAGGLLIAAVFAPASMLPWSDGVAGRIALFGAATVAAISVIVAQLVIHNGIAALFPAWVRITPGAVQPGSVEMMGQGMVVMYGAILALAVGAIAPAAVAMAIAFFVDGTLAALVVFAILLLVESYAATEIIGRVLDRVDLQDVVL